MKRKITLLLPVVAFVFNLHAQTVFYESFTAPFNPATTGWSTQNLSSSVGANATGWFQGTPAKFNGLSGAPADYFAADMNATSATGANNTISAWLITPTLNLVNGAVVEFATLGSHLPVSKVDRVQLYYSADAGTNVGTTAGTATNSAGTFTNILFDINSFMQAGGYPGEWAVLTATLSGIATPTVGRLALRYYVPNGGAAGVNGNYIGIDEFRYSMPCPLPNYGASSGNACIGSPLTLNINNFSPANAITSYTWGNGAHTSAITISPTVPDMNTYYVMAETSPGCIKLEVSNVWGEAGPTVSLARNPTGNICAGSSLTLSATGANSYTYAFGGTSTATVNPVPLVAPSINTNSVITQFTLSSKATGNTCVTRQIYALSIYPNPTVSAVISSTIVCVNKTVTVTADGASTYTWSGAASSTANPITFTTGTVSGTKNFTVSGYSTEGCKSADFVTSLTVSKCTGIEELQKSDAGIYPNPFNNELNLSAVEGGAILYNDLGQAVITLKAGDQKIIDTSNLEKGIYILRTYDASGEIKNATKLVKN